MSKRYKMSRGKSKRVFSASADHVNSKNLQNGLMRGGYRF